MNVITVNASENYEVRIGTGIISNVGKAVKELLSPGKCVIVTDDSVAALYSDIVDNSLKAEGIVTAKFVFPHGETSKCASTYIELVNFLAENGLSRTDAVVALGGGVTGDLAGFAAATYLRGIGLIQIPTTLLAMVDSSVGGKTAIDLPSGKNLCGAFYQPKLVICDIDTLYTLPHEFFLDGCAEVIKYGCIGNIELLEHLEKYGEKFDIEYVVPICVGMKRDIVENDEFDRGTRQLLNLGHTVGHVIEKLSGFEISHGRAVAMGLSIVSESAAKYGYCTNECRNRIIKLLDRFGYSLKHRYSVDELLPEFMSDKKRTGGSITIVIPSEYGTSKLVKMSMEEFRKFISIGVEIWR